MEEENKKSNQEQELQLSDKVTNKVEEKINKIIDTGIQSENVDYLYKLIDIHKDLANEDYWKCKKEVLKMRYRDDYGMEYGTGSYGRRGVPGTGRGRYMARGNYRGGDMIEDMRDMYDEYSENKEEYGRGNYRAKDDTMKSLDYMLKSVVQFMQMLEEDADSEEEMQLIKKYARKISEM